MRNPYPLGKIIYQALTCVSKKYNIHVLTINQSCCEYLSWNIIRSREPSKSIYLQISWTLEQMLSLPICIIWIHTRNYFHKKSIQYCKVIWFKLTEKLLNIDKVKSMQFSTSEDAQFCTIIHPSKIWNILPDHSSDLWSRLAWSLYVYCMVW